MKQGLVGVMVHGVVMNLNVVSYSTENIDIMVANSVHDIIIGITFV